MVIHKIINKTFDKYVLNIVDKQFPIIRKHKYSNKYFLDMFKFILTSVSNWKSLSLLRDYKGNNYHYKYLNQVFNKWSSVDVFKNAYTNMLTERYFKLKHLKNNKNLRLFIDSSFITNMYGSDSIAIHPEYKKKKVTKINIIADNNNNILGVYSDPTHLNKRKKRSFSHDVKVVQNTLNNMNIKIPHKIITKIGGDKGYISKKTI